MKYLILFLLFLASCSPGFQLFETQSDDLTWENEVFVYEDELVRITYDLWEENGEMVFTVYNKSYKPLYLDWSKSSFIKGQRSFKYWRDVSVSKSTIEGVSYDSWLYTNRNLRELKGSVYTVESKPEQVSFIEPGTIVSRRFSPIEAQYEHIFNEVDFDVESCSSSPKKTVKVYSESFEKSASPLQFRNFLTFSFDQAFTTAFSIDTEFYVSKISKMPKKHFELYRPAYSNSITYPFEQSNSFFIKLSR